MTANVAFLERVLGLYGAEAAEARAGIHEAVEEAVRQMRPGEAGVPAHLAPDTRAGNAVYSAIEGNREEPNELHATRVPPQL